MDQRRGLALGTLEILVGLGVVAIGTPLHYLFDFAGRQSFAGFFGPVNESAWEHFKLFYWPLLVLSLLEYPFAKSRAASFWLPKFLSMLVAFAGMSFFFYVPRALLGGSMFISIGSFIAGVILAQLASLGLCRRPAAPRSEILGLILLAVLGLSFILLTFYPPHLIPWLDTRAGIYGIAP